MADTKISALPSGAPAQAGDEYVIARSGANYKLTGTNLLGLVTSTANTFSADQTFGVANATTLDATNVEVTNLKAKDGTAAATVANSTGVIAVSTKVEYADGSASAPAVTNTGDTDTGVYFPAANEVAVTTGGTVAAGFNSNGLFFRNRIINGDMRIDQRNAGASITPNNSQYSLDRWQCFLTAASKYTIQQSSVAPSGFTNSILVTSSSAYSVLAGDTFGFRQYVEGLNVADLAWGTADARAVTISFWVRSSLTGTFGGAVQNSAQNRAYPFTYTISAANTWEQKSVTIPGDTTGTWLTTNGIGVSVIFGLGSGATFSGTAGAWAASNFLTATGAVSVVGTNGATFYVTGVQLETGSVATPFERRPYGTELMLCQRYYYRLFPNAGQKLLSTSGLCFSTTLAGTYSSFPVPMRVAPSALEQSGTAAHYAVWDVAGNQIFGSSVPVFGSATTNIMASVNLSVASGLVAGSSTAMTTGNSAAYLGWSAEL